jgi:hypothetical protein
VELEWLYYSAIFVDPDHHWEHLGRLVYLGNMPFFFLENHSEQVKKGKSSI